MKRLPLAVVLLVVIIVKSNNSINCGSVTQSFALHFKATTLLEVTDSHKHRPDRPSADLSAKNATRSVINQTSSNDNFYEINNKMLPSAKLARAKRQTRVIVDRPRSRNLGRRRPPPFLPPRLPPIARRRFPKRPAKLKFHHKPPPSKNSHRPQYGPPVGYFVMNQNNEIVHKSKDLGDIPPQYLDKIIPPNFISDSPPKIYALEHDEGPPLGLGESKEVPAYTPTNSYGAPLDAHQLDPQQYYPYPPDLNNIPLQSETRPQIDSYNDNRAQSETRYNQEQQQYQPAPIVYHPPYKPPKNKNKRKKKKNPQQLHQEIALQPDSGKNTYPVSSYDVPLNYVPATASSSSSGENYPPQKAARPVFNVGQSFVESYTRDSNEHPPQLPAVYNQNDFKTVNKSSNKKKVVYQVNTSYEDFDDNDDGSYNGDEDHGLALEYPPSSGEEITEAPASNFGVRHRRPQGHSKRKPPKFDFIDSYEDSSISQEVYHTTPFATTRPFKKAATTKGTTTTTATRNYQRTRGTTKDPLFEILDTEDLRNAFQSGRHRYKLQAAKKNQQNFVLLSSKNPTYHRSTAPPSSTSSSRESEEDWDSPKGKPDFDRPPSSLEKDYESYELAERDFGLRKRDFTHKRKSSRGRDEVLARKDSSVEKIQFSDAKRPDEFIKATTMKPYPRFNPDVQFTKTFSSKIEQPRDLQTVVGLWNGHPIPGNHKIAKRGGGGSSS